MVRTNQKLIEKLKGKLAEGETLFDQEVDLKKLAQWDAMTEAYIRSLDPFGSCLTRGTAYNIWDHAKYFGGNYAKDSTEQEAVYFQRVSALETILSMPIKLAPRDDVQIQTPTSSNARGCPFHFRDVAPNDNLVFVLMPFTLDWSDRVWKRHIRKAITSIPTRTSLICLRADDLSGHDVMVDVFENIVKAAVVVADISGRNPNVFYELGMAHALGKRVILITQNIDDIPFDLQRFRHVVYADNTEGCESLEKELQCLIMASLEGDE